MATKLALNNASDYLVKHEADKRVEATKGYFRLALNSLNKLWTPNHNPIVIIGAGFVKNDFVRYLQ